VDNTRSGSKVRGLRIPPAIYIYIYTRCADETVFDTRRFHARFYVTFLQRTDLLFDGFSHGSKRDFVPTPDGGQEVISARFVHPFEALRAHRDKELRFMAPQYYLISTLAGILSGDRSNEAQRGRVREISEGEFGRMVVVPRLLRLEDGRSVFAYGGDEVVDGPVGARHRSVVKPGPGGVGRSFFFCCDSVFGIPFAEG
jgi:hypothetical protein